MTWEDLRVCGRERLIPVCSVTETGLNIEIFHVAGWHNMGLDVNYHAGRECANVQSRLSFFLLFLLIKYQSRNLTNT